MPDRRLSRVNIDGFTSIKEMELQIDPVNVLIGGNAAGKSNLVSFFSLIQSMLAGNFQSHVAKHGSARSLLYYGPKRTENIEATLVFEPEGGDKGRRYEYSLKLSYAAEDKLMFDEERVKYHPDAHSEPKNISLGHGHKETRLNEVAGTHKTVRVVRDILRGYRTFQFHDTSQRARIRGKCDITQKQFLHGDAGNLAAYLYGLRNSHPEYYERIVDTIGKVAPQFDTFELTVDRENRNLVSLNWQEPGNPYIFGPHQLSDGLLRFMALTTLLLQPKQDLPEVVVIDEPELGLHPYAMQVFAGLVRKASAHCQVILATQSASLVDQFDPGDIVTVDREAVSPPFEAGQKEYRSLFNRLEPQRLREWLDDYTLGELWNKNVLGGRPAR